MKLAMSVGDNRYYAIEHIKGRHFIQTAKRGGPSESLAEKALQEIMEQAPRAFESIAINLPHNLREIHESVKQAAQLRLASV